MEKVNAVTKSNLATNPSRILTVVKPSDAETAVVV